jgi:lambda family phage portal protein
MTAAAAALHAPDAWGVTPQRALNWFERTIAFFSPATALRRARNRLQLDQVRRYEGASVGRRTEGWRTTSTSANADLQRALVRLRERHRDLVQNNPWILRAKEAIVSNTIGFGITSKIKGSKTAQKRWTKWCSSTACDADGQTNWFGLQALIWGAVVESGECLVRCRWRNKSDGLDIPMQLQVLEADYLDHSKTQMLATGGRIIQGVELDAIGRRVAYWLFRDHPGEVIGRTGASERVPANEVLHIYRKDRPQQMRGVPWGFAVTIASRDMDETADAFLFRQKISNAQVGVVMDIAPGAAIDEDWQKKQPALSDHFEPGRFDHLPPGKKIEFNNPPQPGDVVPMMRYYLLQIAAAYGITYAALTGDLTRVNFSSGRMGNIDMSANIKRWQWLTIVPQLMDPVVEWFGQALRLTGMAVDGLTASHGMPRREMIDPGKEVAAKKEEIRNGLTSLSAAIRELGEDADEVYAEIAADNEALDALGIVVDCDPRQDAAAAKSKAGTRAKRRATKRASGRTDAATSKAA